MKEVAGPVSNPAILAMLRLDDTWPDGDEVPWCSAALNYWAWLLRLPRSHSLAARSWLGVGEAVPLGDAKVGFDVVVLWRGNPDAATGHVGLFSGGEGGKVMLLGGNQGDAVSVADFDETRVLGVRRLT
jgi:uncharacterized protein (TIGR02594 family)